MKENHDRGAKNPGRLPAIFCLYLLAAAATVPRSQASERSLELVRRAHYVMGTVFEIEAYGEDAERTAAAVEDAFAVIRSADEIMSDYREESELSRLNREGAGGFVPLSPDLYEILRKSAGYSRLTDSAFDVTIGPLVDAWRRATQIKKPLDPRERPRLLSLIGSSHIRFDDSQQAVRFDRPGVRVDLGGIAKGWAVDRAARVLRESGIERALISAGTSTIYALGAPPGEAGWRIAVRHPLREEGILAVLSLQDQSVSTSAGNEQDRKIGGKTYSHILDPRTGRPADAMWSSTVIAPEAAESDALATATFALGLERAERLLRQRGRAGILAGKGSRNSEMILRKIPAEGQAPFWATRKEGGSRE